MKEKVEAKLLLENPWRVAGRPTVVVKWTPTACRNLDDLDVVLYWVLLPRLPPQCLESLKNIGNALRKFASLEKTKIEMLNGATAVIGVQIPDAVPLQLEVDVAWLAASRELIEYTQRLEYQDWTCTCVLVYIHSCCRLLKKTEQHNTKYHCPMGSVRGCF